MELILVFSVLFLVIVWGIYRAFARRKARRLADDAMLDRAWSIVLSDPNYHHRKRSEEQARADRAKAAKRG